MIRVIRFLKNSFNFFHEWAYGPYCPTVKELAARPPISDNDPAYRILKEGYPAPYKGARPKTRRQAQAWGYTETMNGYFKDGKGHDVPYYQFKEVPGFFAQYPWNGGGLTYANHYAELLNRYPKQNNQIISRISKEEHLDGAWWLWRCEVEMPNGEIKYGYVQGDNHSLAPETLELD